MIVRVSGLVSRGGGKDAVQERHIPEKWTLWDPEQHNSGQQLCTGQREVWHTKKKKESPNIRPRSCYTSYFLRRKLCMFSQYIYCVCVGPWAARMAATQRSRIQRLRSKPTSTPPPPRQSLTTSLTMRRSCPPSVPAKPYTHLKVTSTTNVVNKQTLKTKLLKTNSTISAPFKYLGSTWSNSSGKALLNLETGTWLLRLQCEEMRFLIMRRNSCVTFVRKCLKEKGAYK